METAVRHRPFEFLESTFRDPPRVERRAAPASQSRAPGPCMEFFVTCGVRGFSGIPAAFQVFARIFLYFRGFFLDTTRMPAEDPEWLEEKRRKVELQGKAIYESESDSQETCSPYDVNASQGLCDFDSSNPCVFHELRDSMSEISLFSSNAEFSEDTFRALFEIIAKYSRLEAVRHWWLLPQELFNFLAKPRPLINTTWCSRLPRLSTACRRRGAKSFWGEIQLRSALIT